MAWDDVPPTKKELGSSSWASTPPTKEELSAPSPSAGPQASQQPSPEQVNSTFTQEHPLLAAGGGLLKQAGEAGLGLVGKASEAIDPYLPSGAPLRAGLAATGGMHGITENPVEALSAGAKAYVNQFGKRGAPDWTQTALAMGANKEEAPRMGLIGGLGTALINPEGALVGGAIKGIGKAAELAEDLSPNMVGAVKKAVTTPIALAGETSGVGKQPILSYMKYGKEVDALDKKYGGNYLQYADDIRDKINGAIQKAKAIWSGKVKDELSKISETTPGLNTQPVDQAINEVKESINPKLTSGAGSRAEIQSNILDEIDNLKRPDGTISPQDAFDLYNDLRDKAKGTYTSGGQMFTVSNDTAKAAKVAANKIRDYLGEALPDTSGSYHNYSDLHNIDDVINSNMLTPGKTEASLVAAGTSEVNSGRENLKKLGNLIGQDFTPDVDKLAAMKHLGKNAASFSGINTGKSIAGAIIGEHAFGLLGNKDLGGVIGAAASSPLGIKTGINLTRPSNIPNLMRYSRGAQAGSGFLKSQDQNQ